MAQDLSEYENDPRLFLFTSLTAGSSHIITATSRLETILKANKIPFQAIDIATDEKARRLWQRRAAKKKLPGLVKDGFVLGDLEDVEEWNEFGELKENIGPVPASNAPPSGGVQGVNIRPSQASPPRASSAAGLNKPGVNKSPNPLVDESKMRPLPAGSEFAALNETPATSSTIDGPPAPETMNSAPAEKEESINTAKHASGQHVHYASPDRASATELSATESTPASSEETPGRRPSIGRHRGSEVMEAPPEEIKRIESENTLQEEDEDDEEIDATKGIESVKLGGGQETQEQSAKEPDDASKSVED